jgi:peroxiredoxin Q/BCP
MALKINSKAPDFRLQDSLGREFHLYSEPADQGIVLIFYPKAFSPGCTQEVCGFAGDYEFYQQKGIRLIGISHDGSDTLLRFQERYNLPFTLLSDPKRVVCRMYDAVYPFGLLTKRLTYYLDSSMVIRHVSDSLLNPGLHLLELRKFLVNSQLQTVREVPAKITP